MPSLTRFENKSLSQRMRRALDQALTANTAAMQAVVTRAEQVAAQRRQDLESVQDQALRQSAERISLTGDRSDF